MQGCSKGRPGGHYRYVSIDGVKPTFIGSNEPDVKKWLSECQNAIDAKQEKKRKRTVVQLPAITEDAILSISRVNLTSQAQRNSGAIVVPPFDSGRDVAAVPILDATLPPGQRESVANQDPGVSCFGSAGKLTQSCPVPLTKLCRPTCAFRTSGAAHETGTADQHRLCSHASYRTRWQLALTQLCAALHSFRLTQHLLHSCQTCSPAAPCTEASWRACHNAPSAGWFTL